MARRRPGFLLLLLLLLAVAVGTASSLLSGGPGAPRLGGPHRIERRQASAVQGGVRSALEGPSVVSEVVCPGDVLVRVLRARDDAPVAGARVTLQDLASAWTGIADERGEVRYSGIESGSCSLFVYAEGYADRRQAAILRQGGNPDLIVRLGESPLVEGRVVSSLDGKPIKGAEIHAGAIPGMAVSGTSPPSAVTGGEGAFRLRAGEEGQSLTLVVRAKGFAPKDRWILLPAKADAGASVEIALDPTGLLRGVVRDPSGRPMPGAQVVAFPAGSGLRIMGRFEAPFTGAPDARLTADTDGDGAYALEGLALGGLYVVSANASGCAPSEEREVFLPEGEAEARADFDLRPAGNILVKWSVEGLPNGGVATVTLRDSGTRAVVVSTWGRETCRIPEVAPGRYEVVVSATKQGTAPVEVRAGETATVEVPMSSAEAVEGAAIEGIVADSRGTPVPRASVSAIPVDPEAPRPPGPPSGASYFPQGKALVITGRLATEIPGRGMVLISGGALTDAEGRFRVGGLKEGLRYRLSASIPKGYAPPAEPVTAPASGVAIVLSALGRVKGRLVLPAGAAHPRMLDVRLGGAEPSAFTGSVAISGFGLGGFETQDLVPGRKRLSAVAGEYLLPPREIEVRAGETLDLGDLPLERGVTLTGRVVDTAGKPVPQAVVALLGFTGARAVSGTGGLFELGPAPEGEASLSLSLVGGTSVVRTVAVAPGGVVGDLVLPKGGLLRVRAEEEGGRPVVATVQVGGTAAGSAVTWGRTDHMGRFSVSLAPGEYQVSIHDTDAPDRILAEARATLEEGVDSKVVLRFVR